jgi:hypothetical protein
MNVLTSICNQCLLEFPVTTKHFYTANGKLITSICKNCKKEKRKKYKNNKETRKAYYWKNKKKMLAYHKQWRDAKKLKEN